MFSERPELHLVARLLDEEPLPEPGVDWVMAIVWATLAGICVGIIVGIVLTVLAVTS